MTPIFALFKVLQILSSFNIHVILLRCAGFNNVDLDAASEFNIHVLRVVRRKF